MSAEPFRGFWNCAIERCRARRRGMGWGRELTQRTAFLRWETDYSRPGRYHIVEDWLEAGTRVCTSHTTAEQDLEERRKIFASGDAAHPDALEDEIRQIEQILEAERNRQLKAETIRELDRLMSAVHGLLIDSQRYPGDRLAAARDAYQEIRKRLELLVP